MFGFSLSDVVLYGLVLWLFYGVVIACIDSANAAKIIKATGLYFPLRFGLPRWLRRNRRRRR